MPTLSNPKHELFCKFIALEGMSASAAFEAAGFRGDRSNAVKLRNDPRCVGRIAELAAERAEREQLVDEQAKLAAAGDLKALDYLRSIVGEASRLKRWDTASVAAVKALGEYDGSLEPMADQHENMSDEDWLVQIRPTLQAIVKALGLKWSLDTADRVYHAVLAPQGFRRHDVKVIEQRALASGRAGHDPR